MQQQFPIVRIRMMILSVMALVILTLAMSWQWISRIPVLVIFILLIIMHFLLVLAVEWYNSRSVQFSGEHVFITGGSKGLGLGIAKNIVIHHRPACVTIAARNMSCLEAARASLEALDSNVRIFVVSCDVTNERSVIDAVSNSELHHGKGVDLLIANAGSASPGYFLAEGCSNKAVANMNLNYHGVWNTVNAVAPGMLKRRKGKILLVSSGLGLTAYIGYSAYTPTKWAVRGLAETLRSEWIGTGVTIHCAYPPNTDTPGFEEENKLKPKETVSIESGEPTHSVDTVSMAILAGLRRGHFHIACGDLGIQLLISSTAGLSPRSNWITDLLITPLAVLVSVVYRWSWDSAARKYQPFK